MRYPHNFDPTRFNVGGAASGLTGWLAGNATFGAGTVIDGTNGCVDRAIGGSRFPSLAALDASSFAIWYLDGTIQHLKVGTVDAALNITLGSIVTPTISGSGAAGKVSAINSSKILALCPSQTSDQSKLLSYNISGTTLTLDATSGILPHSSSAPASLSECVLSSSRALVCYGDSANANNLTVRGVTIGAGALTLDASSLAITDAKASNVYKQIALIPLTSTTALLVYPSSTNNSIKAVVVTDNGSGSAPTIGTAVQIFGTYNTTGSQSISAAYDSVSGLAVISNSSEDYNASLATSISISGSTITAVTGSFQSNINAPQSPHSIALAGTFNGVPQFVAASNGSYGAAGAIRTGIFGFEVAAYDKIFGGKFKSSGDTSYAPAAINFSAICMLTNSLGIITSGTGTTAKAFAFRL